MRLAALAIAALLLPAGEARACMAGDFMEALIHDALPSPLPARTIVAWVAFESGDSRLLYSTGIRARVRRMVQGDFRGSHLLVRTSVETSCDDPFRNGRSGLIVGIPTGTEDGLLVVHPIMVSRYQRYRLPDGYQLNRRSTP
jgi:hypothetical protein